VANLSRAVELLADSTETLERSRRLTARTTAQLQDALLERLG